MKSLQEKHQGIRTLLSFALIPLSGLATDIYLPSLPSMAGELNVSNGAIQLSLVIFMVSYGISQLFVGSLLDSFGRYRLGMLALIGFTLASFAIAVSHNIYFIYAMRIVQGIAVSVIVVGKRAYFVDLFSGEKLKHYTSLFSIIWATAPIVAPFLGGYLEAAFGWESNFYLLGFFTLVVVALEWKYGKESLRHFQPFNMRSITEVYLSMIKTANFSLGLIMIALCYAMLVVFGMTSPFIIEHVFHYSPIVTGYASLVSGVSLMTGGLISKALIRQPLIKKLLTAITLQLIFATIMIASSGYGAGLYTLMSFVVAMHLLTGFIFNNLFAYCLGLFSKNAGVASGVTGGALYILASFFSYGIVNTVAVTSQALLGAAYLTLAVLLAVVYILFRKVDYSYSTSQNLSKA